MFMKPAKIVWALLLATTSGLVVMATTFVPTMFATPQEQPVIGRSDAIIAPDYYDAILAPDQRLHSGPLDPYPQQAPGWRDTSEFMIGSVRVSVILLESDGGIDAQTENWAAAERTNVRNEIQAALNWWVGRATANGVTLSFSVDWTNLNTPFNTDYEPISRCGPTCNTGENLWIQEVMTSFGYNSFAAYRDNVRDYVDDIRDNAGTDWGFTMFIVDSSNDANNRFTDNWFAYAYLGGPFLVMTYGNDGWGIGRMDQVAAHEVGHIFYALDEYAASGCTTTERGGYLNRANDNCENGGPGHNNIMNHNHFVARIETREMIGWRDSDSDGIEDPIDTFPSTTLNAYSPDPTVDSTPTYTGSASVNARNNANPLGPGNDVTINTISNVQYNVDGGSWSSASASDGSFNEDTESFTFTTSALTAGTHTICARATNSVSNVGSSSCDTLTISDTTPPVANAGADKSANEGATVSFSGAASTDNVGIVSYEWDFDASDGVTFTDATGVSVSHEYGDNGVYTVTLRCKDAAGNSDTDTLTVTVSNVAPVANAGANQAINEGTSASMTGTFSDVGWLDTHTATINWGEGTVEAGLVSEENVKPDATGTVTKTHTYGDNGVYTVTLTVCDDDGACDSDTLTVTVSNVAPTVDALPPVTINEGQSASFNGHATDPGSDDLTFKWTWSYRSSCDTTTPHLNNPPGTDPANSPSVNPRDVTESKSCQYGDNGAFTVTLQVTDDDGGTASASTTVTVQNVNPTVSLPGTMTIAEAGTATPSAQVTDPGSDDLRLAWTWGYRSACDTTANYLNNPPSADPLPSPTVNPRSVTESRSCQYGDNGAFTVSLTATDDDGGTATATMTLTVTNEDPVITANISAYIKANVTLRAAGEKWHDLNLTIFDGSTPIHWTSVYRVPGDPDDQSSTINDVHIDVLYCTTSAVVTYTPLDDPVNGQVNGATPGWIILELEDGSEVWLHHIFNVRHPSTWVWTISDFCPEIDLVGVPIHFEATAGDVGSDDLTFKWDWDDPTSDTITTYFNNGASADPFPSPSVNPISVKDEVAHTYTSSGVYSIVLTVTDDDGGSVSETVTLTV